MIGLALLSLAFAGRVDLNQASLHELDELPGLGRAKATAIIAHREQHGPFESMAGLLDVSGIGPGTLRAVRPYSTLGPTVLAASNTRPPSQEARYPVVASAIHIDPNTAGVVELAALPGVSGPRAEAIVADRNTRGSFESCADLVRVEGIGPATVAGLTELCEVASPPTESP